MEHVSQSAGQVLRQRRFGACAGPEPSQEYGETGVANARRVFTTASCLGDGG